MEPTCPTHTLSTFRHTFQRVPAGCLQGGRENLVRIHSLEFGSNLDNRPYGLTHSIVNLKILLFHYFFFQARPVAPTNLNVQRDSAFPKLGRVTEKMTVEISLMNNIALVRKLS